jgi:hypothetical protein
MSKFLLNLLVQISKALVYSKIKFLFRKEFFCRFRPIRPRPACASPLCPVGHRLPARPTRPKPRWRNCRKAHSLRLCALQQRRLLSHITAMWGPSVSSIPFPTPADSCRFSSSPPYLNSFIQLSRYAPVFNGVKVINAAVTPPGHPSLALPRQL